MTYLNTWSSFVSGQYYTVINFDWLLSCLNVLDLKSIVMIIDNNEFIPWKRLDIRVL